MGVSTSEQSYPLSVCLVLAQSRSPLNPPVIKNANVSRTEGKNRLLDKFCSVVSLAWPTQASILLVFSFSFSVHLNANILRSNSSDKKHQQQAKHMAGKFLFGGKAKVGEKSFGENGPKQSGK